MSSNFPQSCDTQFMASSTFAYEEKRVSANIYEICDSAKKNDISLGTFPLKKKKISELTLIHISLSKNMLGMFKLLSCCLKSLSSGFLFWFCLTLACKL